MKKEKKFSSPAKTLQLSENNSQNVQRAVVPIGPHFQAYLPTFVGPVYKKSDTACWLGTKTWPVEILILPKTTLLNGVKAPEKNLNSAGRGRTDVCTCQFPGTSKCIKHHVAEEKIKLQIELGPAFDEWKFNYMGEGASSNWTEKEKQKIESIVEMDSLMKGDGFLKSALKSLPNKNREAIIGYYFNIFVPKKISMKIKSGISPVQINTDDEEAEAVSSRSCHPKKRSKTKSKPVKRRYLTGIR